MTSESSWCSDSSRTTRMSTTKRSSRGKKERIARNSSKTCSVVSELSSNSTPTMSCGRRLPLSRATSWCTRSSVAKTMQV